MKGAHVVALARGWIGTPYRHRAALKGIGCDCLGLVRGVWRELSGDEPETPPPYSADWAESAVLAGDGAEPLLAAAARHLEPSPDSQIAPGVVLAFRWRRHLPAKHLAIATGAGGMIHAHDRAVVCEVALTSWWLRHLAGVFVFPEGVR